jgi:hypothetical protein
MKATIQVLLAIFICAGAAIAMWWRGLNEEPVIHVPVAYSVEPSDRLEGYEIAARGLKDGPQLYGAIDLEGWLGKHIFSWKIRRHLVNENAGVVAEVAATMPIAHSSISIVQGPDRRLEDAEYVAELMDLKAEVEIHDHDQCAAFQTNLEELEFGAEVPLSGDLNDVMIGDFCENICRSDVFSLISSLGASQAASSAKRMEDIVALEGNEWTPAVKFGKWDTLKSVLTNMRGYDWIPGLFRGWPPNVGLSAIANGKRKVICDIGGMFDAAEDYSILPYRQARSKLVSGEVDTCAAMSALSLPSGLLRYDENRAQDTLIMTCLALRAYHVNTGSYPNGLSKLVPKYLAKAPIDPFSQLPLRYGCTHTSFVLYSVGPDDVDDGGKPIDASEVDGCIYDASRGDIVVGADNYASSCR